MTYDLVVIVDNGERVIPVMTGFDCTCALISKIEMMGRSLPDYMVFAIVGWDDDDDNHLIAFVEQGEGGINVEWIED